MKKTTKLAKLDAATKKLEEVKEKVEEIEGVVLGLLFLLKGFGFSFASHAFYDILLVHNIVNFCVIIVAVEYVSHDCHHDVVLSQDGAALNKCRRRRRRTIIGHYYPSCHCQFTTKIESWINGLR
ncbi:hypothetical protein RJT34_31552 [Clitoria ternatea]|uniref:Uncharacterized protein n=1 Tax=Clitoria ternatea TaxID=43366 RepID=A0AAN9EUW2_CLITE